MTNRETLDLIEARVNETLNKEAPEYREVIRALCDIKSVITRRRLKWPTHQN